MIEKYIGLCASAGGVTTGFDLVLGEIRKGRAKFVLVASDASDRTKKQITDKCAYYNVKFFILDEYSSEAIAHMLGKRSFCAAAAFTGRGPWKTALDALEKLSEQSCDEVSTQCSDS